MRVRARSTLPERAGMQGAFGLRSYKFTVLLCDADSLLEVEEDPTKCPGPGIYKLIATVPQ